MKMNKKGFTLIELLAVIVILAIIALIAVPQVIKILNSARKSAAEDTVYGIESAAEQYVANWLMDNNGDLFYKVEFEYADKAIKTAKSFTGSEDTTGTELSGDNAKLDFKGTQPTSGKVTIDNNGKSVSMTDLVINGFTCSYDATTSTASCE